MDDLGARFRSGDPDAVRDVYRRHGGAVLTVARSIVRDEQLAAEVVQTTFLKAWRAAARFDVDRELAPWLYSIARRTALDVIAVERRPTASAHEPEVDSAADPGGGGGTFEATWEAYEVRGAIDALPDVEREVVTMSHRDGLTHQEIATRLEVPVGTVKSRSNRAHRRLAAALAHLSPVMGRSNPGRTANQAASGAVLPGETAHG